MTDPTDPAGHRARLRARLLADEDGLLDHELVEYLLALAIPRRDTKALAKTLLHEFGGVAGLFSADPDALARVPGMGETSAAAIRIAHAAAVRLVREKARAAPVLGNWQALADYLHATLAHRDVEEFHVLHLNTRKTKVAHRINVHIAA